MFWYQVTGFVGSFFVVLAYIPQTSHLIKEHCSAGISRYAYRLWFLGAVFLFIHAIMIQDAAFTILQILNAVFTGIILVFAERYKYGVCSAHKI
ncbi:MAG: hypothetical protein KGI50_01650 [Patescibacteria group bacterium]|nr:hypothetical protein [Patescibacteria group bacterium]MDE2437952.1 hypothetical protein [Patescibacteria group bacterium]